MNLKLTSNSYFGPLDIFDTAQVHIIVIWYGPYFVFIGPRRYDVQNIKSCPEFSTVGPAGDPMDLL